MSRPAKSSLQSLQRIVEDACLDEVREFVGQNDDNFAAFATEMLPFLQDLAEHDGEGPRQALLAAASKLQPEIYLPVEVEAQRVLLLAEGKGPSALRMIAGQKLTSEEYEAAFEQRGELAVALWISARHRRVFDDAVSFRNARLWRDGKLYSAFDVDLHHPKPLDAAAIPKEKLLTAIQLRLQLSCSVGSASSIFPRPKPTGRQSSS